MVPAKVKGDALVFDERGADPSTSLRAGFGRPPLRWLGLGDGGGGFRHGDFLFEAAYA
jgi:hypothetical protein